MNSGHAKEGAFRYSYYRIFWLAHLLTGMTLQMQTVAVGWYVYEITNSPFYLGLIGLSQFMPSLVLVPLTGQLADTIPRSIIISCTLLLMSVASALLLFLLSSGYDNVFLIFGAISIFGIARAFYQPARQSIVPNLVPRPVVASAIAANTLAMQISKISGPMIGGLTYAADARLPFMLATAFLIVSGALIYFGVPRRLSDVGRSTGAGRNWFDGFRYIRSRPMILGAISLDMFAVLLGGITALLPVFAKDVLHVGPIGLGCLQSAQSVGAILIVFVLMWWPISRNAGQLMFVAVSIFGLATIVFALSDVLWLSLIALAVLGASDVVSVTIRSTLIQLGTPDSLRGRVNAVNQIFVGTSNELGGFRAGVMASLLGPVVAVAAGGVAIAGTVALWVWMFPELRRVDRLD